jgi:hypothetical protein
LYSSPGGLERRGDTQVSDSNSNPQVQERSFDIRSDAVQRKNPNRLGETVSGFLLCIALVLCIYLFMGVVRYVQHKTLEQEMQASRIAFVGQMQIRGRAKGFGIPISMSEPAMMLNYRCDLLPPDACSRRWNPWEPRPTVNLSGSILRTSTGFHYLTDVSRDGLPWFSEADFVAMTASAYSNAMWRAYAFIPFLFVTFIGCRYQLRRL